MRLPARGWFTWEAGAHPRFRPRSAGEQRLVRSRHKSPTIRNSVAMGGSVSPFCEKVERKVAPPASSEEPKGPAAVKRASSPAYAGSKSAQSRYGR